MGILGEVHSEFWACVLDRAVDDSGVGAQMLMLVVVVLGFEAGILGDSSDEVHSGVWAQMLQL